MKVHANLPCLRRKTKTPEKEPNCSRQANRNKNRAESKAKSACIHVSYKKFNNSFALLFSLGCSPSAHPTVPALEAKRKGYGYAV